MAHLPCGRIAVTNPGVLVLLLRQSGGDDGDLQRRQRRAAAPVSVQRPGQVGVVMGDKTTGGHRLQPFAGQFP